MEKEKKSWERPQLTVLGRSKPEEGVLAACKLAAATTPGPSNKTCSEAPVSCHAYVDS
jgi:hypothetical protein